MLFNYDKTGVPQEKEGLFDTILRNKSNYQKRAYQCIKCMVQLFGKCKAAHHLLLTNAELKKKWLLAIDWLQEELDKRPSYMTTAPYTHAYNNWSPPPSNETNSGYFLERSNSAKKTLEKAYELVPTEEHEFDDNEELMKNYYKCRAFLHSDSVER